MIFLVISKAAQNEIVKLYLRIEYGPVPAGKHRKSMETWKQYSIRKVSGFFPLASG
jgi:hypothetical protein